MDALLLALVCGGALIIAYATYGRWVAGRVFTLREDAPTPAVSLSDGKDYCPTRRSIVFGHHFTSIAGTGPIVGPAIAVMWGWLPAVAWVLIGAIFIGAVHDLGSIVVSLRNKGRTLGDIAGDLLGPRIRLIFLCVLVMGLWIVLAVFGLVIANVLKQYPAAIFPVIVQVPLAVVIGLTIHRKGASIGAASVIALVLMYASVVVGDPASGPTFDVIRGFNAVLAEQPIWAWTLALLAYAYAASVLPVWVLLQPRDYINALQLLTTLALLCAGLVAAAFLGGPAGDNAAVVLNASGTALPEVASRVPLEIIAPTVDWNPAGAPPLIPLLFITIACGAVSGFHCLVGSGTTSKQIVRETDARPIGYGAMLTEGWLAILVVIACTAGLGLGVQRAMQMRGGSLTVSSAGETQLSELTTTRIPLRGDGAYIVNAATMSDLLESDDMDEARRTMRMRAASVVFAPAAAATSGMEVRVESGKNVGVRAPIMLDGVIVDPIATTDVPESTLVHGPVRVSLPEGDVSVNPRSRDVRLTGQLAFNARYESWSAAGGLRAMVGAFVDGAANLVASMGVSFSFAVALMGVMVASFAGTTMDTACRLQRYVIQELSRTFLPRAPFVGCRACGYDLSGLRLGSSCPECGEASPPVEGGANLVAQRERASALNPFRWLATSWGAAFFAVLTAAALAAMPAPGKPWSIENAGGGGLILWPLFGATNQLLAGLAFIVIYAWLRATNRPKWFVVAPTVFMLIVPAAAMTWQAFIGNADVPSWLSQRNHVLLGVAAITLALEAWLIIEAIAQLRRGRIGVECVDNTHVAHDHAKH